MSQRFFVGKLRQEGVWLSEIALHLHLMVLMVSILSSGWPMDRFQSTGSPSWKYLWFLLPFLWKCVFFETHAFWPQNATILQGYVVSKDMFWSCVLPRIGAARGFQMLEIFLFNGWTRVTPPRTQNLFVLTFALSHRTGFSTYLPRCVHQGTQKSYRAAHGSRSFASSLLKLMILMGWVFTIRFGLNVSPEIEAGYVVICHC